MTDTPRDPQQPTTREPFREPSRDLAGDTYDPDYGPGAEVSLRDLYLVLLRGLPFILLLAFLGGGVAYFLNAQRKPVYAAESTVLVTPPPIQIQGDENISFSPINEVSFQTYDTLARSQTVLRDAVSRVKDVKISPNQLLSLGTLRQLFGPQRIGDVAPLSVIHRVRNGDPERAALLADAWAQSTLKAVRESLFSSLRPVDETTTREASRLQKNVEEVEAQVQAFAAQDNGPLLEAELEGVTRQITDGRERQGELTRDIAATRARIGVLEQLTSSSTGAAQRGAQGTAAQPQPQGAALSSAFLGVLEAQQALAGAEDGMRPRPQFISSAQLSRTFTAALAESETLSKLLQGNEEEFVSLVQTLYTESVRALGDGLAAEQRVAQRAARTQSQGALELALLGYASAQTQPQADQPADQAAGQSQAAPAPAQQSGQAGQSGQNGASGTNEDALLLLNAAELQRERTALAGMRAERADLGGELEGYTKSAATIQKQLATLDQRRDRLDRELENVLASYNTVAGLQSSISYLTELAPTNARILSQASVPTSPVGPRRAFNTGLVAVTGALIGLVLVFLRAAVRRPPTLPRKVHA